jgi:hypothetical protein
VHANRQRCCWKDAGAASMIASKSSASWLLWPNKFSGTCASIWYTCGSKELWNGDADCQERTWQPAATLLPAKDSNSFTAKTAPQIYPTWIMMTKLWYRSTYKIDWNVWFSHWGYE